jgi:translocation and assembly module TamB
VTAPSTSDEKQQHHHGHRRPWWRWLLWTILVILILPVMLVLILQLEAVQDFIRRQGETYLQKKLHTRVQIGYLRLRGWQYLELRDIYVQDTAKQALLYSGTLKVRYNLLAFINNELRINSLDWDSVMVNVYRNPGDSTFNYQFIEDAFVSKSTTPDTVSSKTGTTIQFHIKDVGLHHVRMRYLDAPGGMTAVLTFDTLHLDPDDLLINDGLYTLRGVKLDGLKGFFKQDYRPKVIAAGPPPKQDTSKTPFHLLLKKLDIGNSSFIYADEGGGIHTGFDVGKLQLLNSSIDLDSTLVQIGGLAIANTVGQFALNPGRDTSKPAPKDSSAPNTWKVIATKAEIDQLGFRFDNNTAPAKRGPGNDPDYNHLLLNDLVLHVTNILYQPDTTSAILHELAFRDKSGFAIKRAHFDFLFTPSSLSLNNLLLETNQSLLQKRLAVTVPSWSTLSNNMDLLQLTANIDSSHITLAEWLPFVPNARANKSMKPLWDKQIFLTTSIKGSLGKLIIETLRYSDNVGNQINAKGQVEHAMDVNNLYADFPSLYISSGNKALRAWLPPHTMPDTPRLPEHMLITGNFIGGMKDMQTKLNIKSNAANAALTAHLVNIMDSIRARYNVNIASFQVQPGYLLYDSTLGWIKGRLSADGVGYSFPGMMAKAALVLNEATYNKYTYKDINLNANIDKEALHADGASKDTSITLVFNVDGTLDEKNLKTLQAKLQMDKADLYAVHLVSNPLDLKGNLDADFSSLEPQRLEGKAFLDGWQVATNGQVFAIDTVQLDAHYQDKQYISLVGPFGFINADGTIDYTKIGPAFARIINKPLQPLDSGKVAVTNEHTGSLAEKTPDVSKYHLSAVDTLAGQVLEWNAQLKFPHSLQAMAPGLRMEQPLVITGRMNSDSSLLNMNASLVKITYDSLRVDSIALNARIQDTAMQADLSLARLYHKLAPLYHTAVNAHASGGKVNWNLLLDDQNRKPRYRIGGYVDFLPENAISLSLKQNMLLNKQRWQVDPDNHIHLKNGMPDTAKLTLSYQEQSLALQTRPDSAGSSIPALQANIKDFKLSTITALIATDTALVNGILNGDAHVSNLDKSPMVNTTMKVDSLQFRGSNLGTLNAHVETPQASQYKMDVTLQGNDNDLHVTGSYDTAVTAQLDINKLNMKSLEGFTMGNMNKMHGSIDGKVSVSGNPSKPKITGNMHFDDAGGNITQIGTAFTLPDETLVIDEKGIQFNNFVIQDSSRNELVMNGRVNTKDYTNFNFNLDVNADNFMVLGHQQDPKQLYYGPAYIDTRIKVRGNMDLPRVDAYLKLRDKSNVTVTLPSEDPGVASREGVVVFVDKSNPVDSALLKAADSLRYQNPRLKGINFSGVAELTPESTIRIIIDPANGDYVEAKGAASINATLDPSSKMSLTGRYEIQEGKYEMSLNQLIKRSFSIEKGSAITFAGDATDADLDITAKYTVNAPAADLVQDQLTNLNAEDKNRYRQKLPFYVYLHIKGQLLKPEISFELDMPEADQGAFSGSVYNRLKQINQIPSELNKQVMGLLVLNQFIPEDPLAGDGGGSNDFGVSNMARQSVSKILSQQLNSLAGNLIKGVDLNFDVQSGTDYSTGSAQETTNLKVGASKSLFNGRLSVSVGSNVMLQGENQANPSQLIGDISAEYKLTADGRYRVRVYQQNDNDMVVEGQIVETGVAFALIMDYDEFREIFHRVKKQQQQQKLRTTKKK